MFDVAISRNRDTDRLEKYDAFKQADTELTSRANMEQSPHCKNSDITRTSECLFYTCLELDCNWTVLDSQDYNYLVHRA